MQAEGQSSTPPLRLDPGMAPGPDFIPLCIPHLPGNAVEYVAECVRSGMVSSAVGSYLDRFERAVADTAGAQYGVATVNGTAALHVALLLCGVGTDDEVLTSSLSFIAPANAIRYAGAWPVFIDAEPVYWQMDTDLVATFLRENCTRRDGALFNRRTGRRIAALLPVHVLGHPVDLDPLLALAEEYGVPVIEDATESLGATYRQRRVGGIGRIGCFSFNGNKLITTGGGGMLVTNDAELADRARYLTTQAKDDPVEYFHKEIGYNYRLTNLQAALGVAQMEELDGFIAKKRAIAARYAAELGDLPGFSPMQEAPWAQSVFWMYTARVGSNSRDLLRQLHALRIQTRPLWQALHQSPAHAGAECVGGAVAEALVRDCLSLPCSAGMSDADQTRVITALRSLQIQ